MKLMQENHSPVMKRLLTLVACLCSALCIHAQELNAKVSINSSKIAASAGKEIFDELQQRLQDFINEKAWTELQFKDQERINCTFNITINKWSAGEGAYECSLLMNSTRPVFNSSYNTTVWSTKDDNFNFTYLPNDPLEYNAENLTSNLIALVAYYAYMVIGMDMETFSPSGGTTILNLAEDVVTKGQDLGYEGWKAFDDSKNRFGLLNDYLDGSMESMRTLFYKYHRDGLDHMTENTDEARAAILEALGNLETAHSARTMSSLPQLFTEYKRDEIINIFADKGKPEERNRVYDILSKIDPSQTVKLERLKK